MKTVFNRGKCVVMRGASRRALRAVIFNHKQSMQIEFCARSQEICGQSIVSIVGRPKKNRPENGAVSVRAIMGSDQRQRRRFGG
jgi:hypothetical protein